MASAGGGQFGAGVDDAGDDHGDNQIAHAAGGTSDEGMQVELLDGAEDDGGRSREHREVVAE